MTSLIQRQQPQQQHQHVQGMLQGQRQRQPPSSGRKKKGRRTTLLLLLLVVVTVVGCWWILVISLTTGPVHVDQQHDLSKDTSTTVSTTWSRKSGFTNYHGAQSSSPLQKPIVRDTHNNNNNNNSDDTVNGSSLFVPPRRTPTHHACDDTTIQGIYHIQMTDELGGVGTAFFQLVIGQILYAETYHLKPWIYFNNFSQVFYDPVVHGPHGGTDVSVTMRAAAADAVPSSNASYVHRRHGHKRDYTPGPPPVLVGHNSSLSQLPHRDFTFSGTGVWEHYFEPISDYVPGDVSCRDKAYVTMDLYLITPGLHGYDPALATRCWRYDYLPDYITQPHLSYHEWWEPQRVRAHRVVSQYFRFRPHLTQAVTQRINPYCQQQGHNNREDGGNRETAKVWCLGIHVRHSDKAAGRRVLPLDAFVPYVQAFFEAGGDYLYVATDSAQVINDIQSTWPSTWQSKIRHLGNQVVRSTNRTAVFDLTPSHHRTNQEVLMEILALSHCHFLVSGLSAVSETSIWINLNLHNRSVNLEDPQHIAASDFAQVVQATMAGETDPDALPQPPRTNAWWNALASGQQLKQRSTTVENIQCDDKTNNTSIGVLLITNVVEEEKLLDDVLWISVLPQMEVAQQFHLHPLIFLDPHQVELIYDANSHNVWEQSVSVIPVALGDDGCPILPSPTSSSKTEPREVNFTFSDIWDTYFQYSNISHQQIKMLSCVKKPVYWFDAKTLSSMAEKCPSLVQSRVSQSEAKIETPDKRLNNNEYAQYSNETSGKNVMSQNLQFHPVLWEMANEVNPIEEGDDCMGILFQMTLGHKGATADKYLPYLKAFVQASSGSIYVASDTFRPIRYMQKNFPAEITDRFRSQGTSVARSSGTETPVHMMDSHHRVNSEMLVDILALSQCRVLVHSSSAMAELIVALSKEDTIDINLEDERTLLPSGLGDQLNSEKNMLDAVIDDGDFTIINVSGAKVLSRKTGRGFSQNAIVYLAQKKHSTYGRDSFGTLLRSLQLLRENYLEKHMATTDIFIFHVDSFKKNDLVTIEQVLGPASVGSVRLVDLDQSAFWSRPDFLQDSDPHTWYAYPLFSEGYRHMIQFFAIWIWEFWARFNSIISTFDPSASGYRYMMRLDEDSFLHSPIDYDIFEFMETSGYKYGFRMCSYEMQTAKKMWKRYQQFRPQHVSKRELELQGCGFYNNFFVADIPFFRQANVQDFLRFIYDRGHIYTWRLGDLMIHTMAIYKFAHTDQVHRFLDFTYEHGTTDNTTGCLVWGGMQAGYADTNATKRLAEYYTKQHRNGACPLNQTKLTRRDLSPSYSHLPEGTDPLSLDTVVAGNVEVLHKGLLSG